MPLAECRDCAQEVSEEAVLCPGCGSPNPASSDLGNKWFVSLQGKKPSIGEIAYGVAFGLFLFGLLSFLLSIFLIGVAGVSLNNLL